LPLRTPFLSMSSLIAGSVTRMDERDRAMKSIKRAEAMLARQERLSKTAPTPKARGEAKGKMVAIEAALKRLRQIAK